MALLDMVTVENGENIFAESWCIFEGDSCILLKSLELFKYIEHFMNNEKD